MTVNPFFFLPIEWKNTLLYASILLKQIVMVIPCSSVSTLFGLSLFFYKRANNFFCCVNQTTECWLYNEIDEACRNRLIKEIQGKIEQERLQ